MSDPWHALIAEMEAVNHCLAAADLNDFRCLEQALEKRAQVLRAVRGALVAPVLHGTAPPELCGCLEQARLAGEALYLRLKMRRAALGEEWDGQNQQARWLREIRGPQRRPSAGVDCRG